MNRIINGWAVPDWWATTTVDDIIARGAAEARRIADQISADLSRKYWTCRNKTYKARTPRNDD